MPGTTTKLSTCFGVVVTLEIFLTATEININKVQKQDFKNIDVKRCRDGKPKCMQTRYSDVIIVKVNLQSPIPTSFYITVSNWCENDAGMRLCKFTITIISSLYLVCLLFGMPSLHLFTFIIFLFLQVC